jgi:hypothetical protein
VVRLLGMDRPVLQQQRMLGEPADVAHRARHDAVPHPLVLDLSLHH